MPNPAPGVGDPDDVHVGLDDGAEALLAQLQPAALGLQLLGERHLLPRQRIAAVRAATCSVTSVLKEITPSTLPSAAGTGR